MIILISVIVLASNSVYHTCTKHVEVDYRFIRDIFKSEAIQIHFISSINQLTGIFTKDLNSTRFQLLKDKLDIKHSPFNLQRGR